METVVTPSEIPELFYPEQVSSGVEVQEEGGSLNGVTSQPIKIIDARIRLALIGSEKRTNVGGPPERFVPPWIPGLSAPADRFLHMFEEHSAGWGQGNMPPPGPVVSLPADVVPSSVPVPSTDSITTLRAEIMGLSQTVKSMLDTKSSVGVTSDKAVHRRLTSSQLLHLAATQIILPPIQLRRLFLGLI